MKKYRKLSILKRKPSYATTESTLSVASKDEWNTKESTGKPMNNALYILRYGKRAEATLNIERIKHVALDIVEIC